MCRRFQSFGKRCDCTGGTASHEELPWNYLNRNAKNREIATGLSYTAMNVLRDAPPPVPPRGEPMVSVLTSRKRKPRWERMRLEAIKRRRIRKKNNRFLREPVRRWYADENNSEETSEEESIA